MKAIYGLLFITLIFTACNSNSSKSSEQTEAEVEKVLAVSIYDGVPVRATPEKDGKYLTSLNLGETMSYLGETIADSIDSSKKFHKVELSDGSIAWARTYGVILDGEPAAIISETPIYKRPDLVNKTSKSFNPLEFAIIINKKDDWVEVTGAKKKKSGWIKLGNITTEKAEVAVSTLAQKNLLDAEGLILSDKVAAFWEELPYKTSKLGAIVKLEVDKQLLPEVEDDFDDTDVESQDNSDDDDLLEEEAE